MSFERETKNESFDTVAHACNILYGENDSIYYFSIGKYFNRNIYHGGTVWICENKIISAVENGIIADNALTDDDKIRLIKANLIIKDGDKYKINFAVFTVTQYDRFKECFNKVDARLDGILTELIVDIHKCFKTFVPKRLDSQINQWVDGYVSNIISYVAEELINRGVMEKPDDEKPLTNGVFYIKDGRIQC